MDYYTQIHSLTGFLPYTLSKILAHTLFFSGALLLFPLIMVRRVFLDRRVRFLVVAVLILAAGMAIEIYLLPHYLAVYTAAFYAIGVQMMRHLRQWKPEAQAGWAGAGALDHDCVRCISRIAGLRGAASFCTQRMAAQQLEFHVVWTATVWR